MAVQRFVLTALDLEANSPTMTLCFPSPFLGGPAKWISLRLKRWDRTLHRTRALVLEDLACLSEEEIDLIEECAAAGPPYVPFGGGWVGVSIQHRRAERGGE